MGVRLVSVFLDVNVLAYTERVASLYQGRSWARYISWDYSVKRCLFTVDDRKPSPPAPASWPLSWIKPAVNFSEMKMLELRGVDATLYIRFLRGCCTYCL